MKKFLTAALVMALAVIMIVPASAANWSKNELTNKFDEAPEWYDDAEIVEFIDYFVDGETNAMAGVDYVYLKALDKGDFTVEFEVGYDGIYNIGFSLMGWTKSVLRTTNIKIDDSDWVYVAYDYVPEDQNVRHYWSGLQIPLTKGKHTFTLSLASDFDNETVKSLYFYDMFFAKAADIPVETEAPVTEAPATQAPEPSPAPTPEIFPTTPAPQTFDLVVAAAVLSAISLAGAIISKKK